MIIRAILSAGATRALFTCADSAANELDEILRPVPCPIDRVQTLQMASSTST